MNAAELLPMLTGYSSAKASNALQWLSTRVKSDRRLNALCCRLRPALQHLLTTCMLHVTSALGDEDDAAVECSSRSPLLLLMIAW